MGYIEVWWKVWCPSCEVPNWVCDGDPSDLTVGDIEAIKCWKCKHSWWVTEDEIWLDTFCDDATPEDHAEEGKEKPE